jgi:predicted nucleic acid-binding protein
VDGYLIDTQTVCYWFDDKSDHYAPVMAAVNRLPADSPLYISAITLGEIEYGHAINPAGAGAERDEFIRFIRSTFPQVIEISKHTAEPYGRVRAHLAQKFPPAGGWSKKRRAEQMYDAATAVALGIDENDLWLVAQAIERGLVFVSTDRMTKIRQAVIEVYPAFLADDWAKP